jgi:hypothetical protein
MKKILAIGLLFLCLALTVPSIAQSQPTQATAQTGNQATEKIYSSPSRLLNYTQMPYNATLYAELMLPGYYTPQEHVPSKSMLLSDPAPVEAYVVCDDDMFTQMQEIYWWRFWQPVTWDEVYMWAWNILEGGDDPFETNFQIDFKMEAGHYTNWDSAPGTLYQLYYWGIGNFSSAQESTGCQVLVIMSGQSDPDAGGWGGGDTFIIGTRNSPQANLVQHEASHLYGCPDHTVPPEPNCVMSYDYTYSTRAWCASCTATISANRYTFG